MTALAGVESTIGYADGRIVPQVGTAFGDMVAGYFGNLLVMAALYQREQTGKGAIIDMSQTEASAAMAGVAFAEFGISGKVPVPSGNTDPYASPHGIYRTMGDDDWVALATWSDEEWSRLCQALEIPQDVCAQYATTKQRLEAVPEIDELVEARTVLEPRDELYVRLQALGIACTPVLSTEEVDDFPALVDRNLWTLLVHPRLGELRMTAIPWEFDHRELSRLTWAEQIGTSTDSVLTELLGAGEEDLEKWRHAGALD
jgi:benzylsuccinate CoA-transferase BbsF subunit